MRSKVVATAAIGLLIGMAAAVFAFPGPIQNFFSAPKTWTVGKAAIGGPFALVNHDGQQVTEKSYSGEFTLVFFGFTYCPDICPAALQTVSAVMDDLGPRAKKLRPLFITVDPERDTPDVLKEYLSNFHKRIVGLTGTPEQVSAAAKVYRAYFRKVEDKSVSDEYTVDHSAFLYLMSPNGEFITHFTHATPPDKIQARLRKVL